MLEFGRGRGRVGHGKPNINIYSALDIYLKVFNTYFFASLSMLQGNIYKLEKGATPLPQLKKGPAPLPQL